MPDLEENPEAFGESSVPVVVEQSGSIVPGELKPAEVGVASGPETSTTQVVIRRTHSPAWAVAAVFVAAIVAATFLIYTVVYSVPAKVIETGGRTANAAIEQAVRLPERLAGAFKPNVIVKTLVSSGIENVKRESKLVVLTAEVDVEIDKSSEMRVLWDAFKLGDTTVRLRVRDNKVQYVVPLKDFGEEDIAFSAETNSLLVTVPAPRLDSELVEVQSNPDAIDAQTDVGWGRLLMYSGDALMDEAKRELRDAVLREGANPLLQEKARSGAESAVRDLLKAWLPELREDVELRVQFS